MSIFRTYLRALGYFRNDRGRIALLLSLIGLSTLFGLLEPFPVAILIDSVLQEKEGNWLGKWFMRVAPSSALKQIILLAAIMLSLRLLKEVLSMTQSFVKVRISYGGLMRVRCDLFRKLQELSLNYHRSKPQGDAIYRLSYDTQGVQSALNMWTGILVNAITLIIMACIMFAMEWRLALVAISIMPLLVLAIKRNGKILRDRSLKAKEVDSELTTAIQRSVASIGLVQAFGREEDEFVRFHERVHSSVRAWLRLHWQETVYWLAIGAIFGIGSAAIFGYGGYLVIHGKMSPGDLTIFMAYLGRLYGPLNALTGSGASMQSGVTGVTRVFEILDMQAAIKDAPDAMHLPRRPRVLHMSAVGFEYREGHPVLRDIEVTIPPGQMVAFVGSSGVGKTTLLNLLPRFYDPTTGSITLDGHDLRKVKIKDLRKHVALVLQEGVILPTTVAENIAYGRPDASAAEIKAAAELSGANTFIEQLPEGYDTKVSEAGQNLSGGQRQRIGIARALATEAPILVLDEPTSALDPQNEQMITETLNGLKGRRTIILVSHRLSTVFDSDQIFVMDEGRIVERGTHSELLARRGVYYRMAKHQLKLSDPAEPAAV